MMQYFNLPLPVSRVHFRIYRVPTSVLFTERRVNKVILVGHLMQEISDAIEDIAKEE